MASHEREFKRLKEELIDEAYAKQILRGVESASQQFEQERLAADAKTRVTAGRNKNTEPEVEPAGCR